MDDVTNTLNAIDIRKNNCAIKFMTFLFEAYEPQYWWWECYVCIDRLLMTNLNIILHDEPELRVFFALAIALGNVKLCSQLDPYIDDTDDTFAEVAKWCTVAIIIFSITLQCGAVGSTTSGTGYILVILLASVMICFMGFSVYTLAMDMDPHVFQRNLILLGIGSNTAEGEEQDKNELELIPVTIEEDPSYEAEVTGDDSCFTILSSDNRFFFSG